MSSWTRHGRFTTRAAPRSSRRLRQQAKDEIPEVYKEMLAEAEARETGSSGDKRPTKRLKPAGYEATFAQEQLPDRETQDAIDIEEDAVKKSQTIYNLSSESEESDMEWEDVNIQQFSLTGPSSSVSDDAPLQITLGQQEGRKRRLVRYKPVTAAEKKLRLDIHKTHLLCLLSHAQRRNLWCCDEAVQKLLREMLPKHIRSQLNPPENKAQHTRSATFLDGLNQAGDIFTRRFRVTKPGLRRAYWAYDSDSLRRKTESIMSDAEVFLSKENFQKQAKSLQGSRDFGAQLFCALLRSVSVEARLVCSLQPLPFAGTMEAPSKPEPQPIVISSDNSESSTYMQTNSDTAKTSSTRRLGRPTFKPTRPYSTFPARSIPSESSCPVFWVEAFNEAFQKWIVIDPMATRTLGKPYRLEPPTTDPYNLLSYVIAFEGNASARDVTRRYTKTFNAKIRKLRVESTKNGEPWWKRVFEYFEKPFLEDRDVLEIGELTAKTASEPMPRNVQDFKNHPVYALERHLRRNEVIFPKRATGQVSLGKAGTKGHTEPVYRRSDVHALRNSNKWYQLGRDIKMGEQALKHIPARHKAIGVDDEEEPGEIALYAYFQTELYQPPPVIEGKVPKNAYGNLDIYVPSMVPPGGIHIRHLDAAYAARVLGIDYADAVTGFNFKGRHGTAIIQGVVVAAEYLEAVQEVLNCIEEEKLRNKREERTAQVLRTWKHFLLKFRIAERVKSYAVEGEADGASRLEESEESEELGSGFFSESGAEMASPFHFTSGSSKEYVAQDEEIGGGFLPESDWEMASRLRPRQPELGNGDQPLSYVDVDDLAGGLVPDGARVTERVPESATGRHKSATTESRYTLVVVSNNIPITSVVEQRTATENADEDRASVNKSPLGTSVKEPITAESTVNVSTFAGVEVLSRVSSQAESRTQSVEGVSQLSEDDKGSLLSEDPDDEDAVPEWLISD